MGPIEAQIQRILGRLGHPKKFDKDRENKKVGMQLIWEGRCYSWHIWQ